MITGLMTGLIPALPKYVGWGIGDTAALITNNYLNMEASEARVEATLTQEDCYNTHDQFRALATLRCLGAHKDIVEVGLFSHPTTGYVFLHCTFDLIHVEVNDTIQFSINIIFV